MTEEERKLREIATARNGEADVTVDYMDDEIIIIDNVKLLTSPEVARMKMNTLAFCNSGKVQLDVNGHTTLFDEDCLLICPPNTTFANIMLSPDSDFKAIFMTDKILTSFLREKMNIWTELFYIYKMYQVPIDDNAKELLRNFYGMFTIIIKNADHNPFREESVRSILQGAILSLCGMLKQAVQENSENHAVRKNVSDAGSAQILFQQFISLLNNSPQKHRTVESFADELCITPKYLSSICKKQSGKTANAWIQEHVVEDIRYYLKQTNYSIKQICTIIGFPNPSFFGKYVKDHFGTTPAKLRGH